MRKRIQHLLFESELHLLFEDYRTDKIMQMVNKRLPEEDRLEQEELEQMIEADPTAKNGAGKYSEWIVKQYINSDEGYRSRFFEDLYKYTNALKKFHELKVRNKIDVKDINQVENLWTLQELIKGDEQESILEGFPDTSSLEASGDIEVILRDPEIHIYWTKTQRGNTFLGSNTSWCTVPKGNAYFQQYSKQGPIFVIYAKEDGEIKRYQYHFESDQFMNHADVQDKKYLTNFRARKAFINFARKHNNGLIAFHYKDEELLSDPKIQKSLFSDSPSDYYNETRYYYDLMSWGIPIDEDALLILLKGKRKTKEQRRNVYGVYGNDQEIANVLEDMVIEQNMSLNRKIILAAVRGGSFHALKLLKKWGYKIDQKMLVLAVRRNINTFFWMVDNDIPLSEKFTAELLEATLPYGLFGAAIKKLLSTGNKVTPEMLYPIVQKYPAQILTLSNSLEGSDFLNTLLRDEFIQDIIINNNPVDIIWIPDPPEELQLRTVNKRPLAYWYIKKPTRKVKELAIKRFREEGMEAEAESVESGEKGLYQM